MYSKVEGRDSKAVTILFNGMVGLEAIVATKTKT